VGRKEKLLPSARPPSARMSHGGDPTDRGPPPFRRPADGAHVDQRLLRSLNLYERVIHLTLSLGGGCGQDPPMTAAGDDARGTARTGGSDDDEGPGGGERIPIHRRTIDFEAYEDGDEVSVLARLRDERPWAAGAGGVEHVHDLSLRVAVRKDDQTIVAAEAAMDRFPHAECPSITPHFATLVGLRVGRGYTRAVQERFGGVAGCTHLDQLARALGPVVVQAVTSCRAKARDWAALDAPVTERSGLFSRNTCHVWADGGPAEQKLAAGWRPGVGGYPAPPVAVVLRGRPDRDDHPG